MSSETVSQELWEDRNVRIFDTAEPPKEIAGFKQHGSMSIQSFYKCLDIIVLSSQFSLLFQKLDDGTVRDEPLQRSENAVMPEGNFVILQPDATPLDTLEITSEHYRPRIISLNRSGSPGVASFTSRVRERDRRCCISGSPVYRNLFISFRTSHIYPIAHIDTWNNRHLSECILDDAPEEEQGASKINSVQNGLLLRTDVQSSWDAYFYGVDVDNDYRIIAFGPDSEYDGQQLYIDPQKPPHYRPSPDLLRDHFKQCVLANMRGKGERDDLWDHEDPHDLSGEIWQASSGGYTRLELELATRLGGLAE